MNKKQNQMNCTIVALLLATVLILTAHAFGQEPQVLSLRSRIPLTNVKGRIDHFGVDVKGQRLFVAAVGNHTLEVIDLQAGKQVHTISGLAEPQGVFYDASTNRLYVACVLDGTTKIYDGTTFRLLITVKFPDDADNIRHDARSKSIIVGYAGAKALRNREEGTGGLGFIDSGGKTAGEVVIDAHPESFRLEKTGTRLFVNVPDKEEIEAVDVVSRKVVAHWPVTFAKDNFPMALDEAHHRLFVGTRTAPRLLVYDTEGGKEIASAEIAGSSDDLFYDSARGRIYVLTSQGAIDVFQQREADHYDHIARITTPAHTQTGLYVPEWGQLFAAVPSQGDHGAEIHVYEAK
jgi:DNA-binding beta-propeller fold protein YncE